MNYYYITNNPFIASICEENHVIPWIDLEVNGKEERQRGMDTVKSNHSVSDIKKVKAVLKKTSLMVRINPLYEGSKMEIDEVIKNGADLIMLPMFQEKKEVEEFITLVNRRAKTVLLFETKESIENIDDILQVEGIDKVHIGLNDLHLSYNLSFMFELISNGMVSRICKKFNDKGISYGFGGIARLGYGSLLAEFIIIEHYRLLSNNVILSRSFINADDFSDLELFKNEFKNELNKIESFSAGVLNASKSFYDENHTITNMIISNMLKERESV